MDPRAGYSSTIKQPESARQRRLVDVCATVDPTAAQYTAMPVLHLRPEIATSMLVAGPSDDNATHSEGFFGAGGIPSPTTMVTRHADRWSAQESE